MKFHAYAADSAGAELKPFAYDPGELGTSEVQVKVEACGICHSDISLWKNEWGLSDYPLVPGHEVVGIVEELGPEARGVSVGDRVGVGWFSRSCMVCDACMSGDHNLCGTAEGIAIGRHGGFADRVRVDAAWAVRVPPEIPVEAAGPLFCGGITVFNPIVQCGVKPTDRVGVVGIGGLGHMALQFLDAWGCHVTAFSSSPAKEKQARAFGADAFVSSRDPKELEAIAGSLDFILVTVNVPLEWESYFSALRARGRLHVVGAVLEPIPTAAFSLIMAQKTVSGTPLGSPATTRKMLEFTARHGLAPKVEAIPFAQVNEALARLETEKPAHRLVLVN